MGRALKIKKVSEANGATGVDIGFNNPASSAGTGEEKDFYGVVGGDTDLSTSNYPTIKVRVYVTGASEADGYIIRQKGSGKFLVSDGTNEGVCVLENEDDASLNEGFMTVTVTLADSSEVRLKRFTNKWGIDFSGNRYLLNFFDVAASVVKSGGGTVELVQVDNPNFYG